jgi:hypothetical protein
VLEELLRVLGDYGGHFKVRNGNWGHLRGFVSIGCTWRHLRTLSVFKGHYDRTYNDFTYYDFTYND